MSGLANTGQLPGAAPQPVVRGLYPVVPFPGDSNAEDLERDVDRSAPRVSWLAVDGFGALSNVAVDGLGNGVTVLLGPNEAGKSTIFDFLTAILFGFPPRKSDDRYRAPLTGARHGGRVGLTDPAGNAWVVERHASPQKRLTVTRPDGSLGDEGDLRRLLGGANAELFRAVFAVDLDDLRRLDGMSSDEVRETLFSSSILGQRRSAARAMKELDNKRDTLVRPRQGGTANAISSELHEVRRALTDARHAAQRFASMRREAERLAVEVASLKQRQEDARSAVQDYALLEQCWEAVTRRRQFEARLIEHPPLSSEEAELLALDARLSAVRTQFSGHSERLNFNQQAGRQQAKLIESIEGRTSELGGAWAVELAGDPSFEPQAVRAALEPLHVRLGQASSALSAARSGVTKAEQEAASITPTAEPADLPSAEQIRVRLVSLRELRSCVSEIDQLERDVERDAELERSREAGHSGPDRQLTRAAVIACVAAAVLFVAVAGLLMTRHQTALGGVVAVFGAVFGAVAWWLVRAARKTPGPSRHSEAMPAMPTPSETLRSVYRDRLVHLSTARDRAAELAQQLGIDGTLSAVRLQRSFDDLDNLADQRRRHDHDLDRSSEAARRLAVAASDEQEAARELERALDSLAGFVRANHLPATTEPGQLPSIVDRLAVLTERVEALRRVEDDLESGEDAIRSFEARVVDLAAAFGIASPSEEADHGEAIGAWIPAGDLEAVLTRMSAQLEDLRVRAADRAGFENAVAGTTREIDRMLGDGDRAGDLRERLESGRVLDWESESRAARQELEALESRHEEVVREHEGLSREINELAASTDIPRLEQRCLELEEALHEATREYLVASGARFLLSRTLKRYEEQRQPVVLERAAAHFTRVTAGRYVRLGVDSAPDGSKPSVRVLRPDGSGVDATALSRGTMEQLYLCLRLGLAESFADRYLPLPIVLDDVLVNFDPQRQESVVRELVSTAERHQVLVLTCHPAIAELVSSVAGSGRAKTIELDRS